MERLIAIDPDVIDEWQKKLHFLAHYWATRWAWHEDHLPLVEDLVMAGWIAVLEFGPDHPRVLWEVQNGMQEALCLWMYGVGRRSKHWERRISKRLSVHPSRHSPYLTAAHSVEAAALRRVGLQRLWDQLSPPRKSGTRNKDRAVLCLLAEQWPATTIHAEGRQDRRQAGISDRALYNGRRRIRRIAKTLDLHDADS